VEQKKVKEMAAGILKCGCNAVWIDPMQGDKAKAVMTKEDVRELIKSGVITKRHVNSQSRGRARVLHEKKKKGRKRGKGKRKGTKKARSEKKASWIKNVRSQRKMLKQLKKEKPADVEKIGYRVLYKRVKGGYFKGKNYLRAAVEERKR
jgi:large subunit ribosomal protein L19e